MDIFGFYDVSIGPIKIIFLISMLLMIISIWRLFKKVGEPGWKSLIPIYNLIILLKITGLPLMILVLLLIPILNFFILPCLLVFIFYKISVKFNDTLPLVLIVPIMLSAFMIFVFGGIF